MRQHFVGVLLLAGITAAAIGVLDAQQAPSPEELLGKGLHQEQVQGNCKAAITTYKTVAEHPRVKKATAGRALLQLAGCYERLGRPEARAAYQRVLASAPADSAAYAAARAKIVPAQSANDDPFSGRNIDGYFKDASMITPSPSGTSVAYTKPKAGRSTLILGESTPITALYLRDLSNGQERLLVDPGDRLEVLNRIVWSPDASQIAYSVQLDSVAHPVKDGWAFDLRVVDAQRGESRTIVRAQSGRSWFINWSPDSSALAFETPNTTTQARQLTVWTRADGASRVLGTMQKDPRAPAATIAWSPDGNQVAFIADGTASDTLTVASRKDGTSIALRLPPFPAGARLQLGAWNVNGEISVIHQIPQVGNDFYMVPADQRPFRKTCEGRAPSGGDACQAPDAFNSFTVVRRIKSEAGRTYLKDLATGAERALTDASVFEQPVLLPARNGKLIAFRSDREGDFGVYVAPVDRLPVRHPLKIARLDSATSQASGWWTPDGLVLNLSRQDSNVYRVNIDPATGRPTGPPQRLTQDSPQNSGGSPSQDGKRIAYRVWNRQAGVAMMDANGANERLILPIAPGALFATAAQIGWRSPTELVLHPGRVTGKPGISTLNLQSGMRQLLAQPDIDGAGLQYVAAADEIVYWRLDKKSDAGTEIWARSVKTGSDRLVAKTRRNSVFYAVDDRLTRVFYTTADETTPDGKPVPVELRVVNVETGEDKLLASLADSKGSWNVMPVAGHARHLLYRDDEKALRVIDIESGQSWALLTEPLKGIELDGNGEWAPDGSYVFFTGFSERRSERRQWTGLTYDAVSKLTRR
jgi:Tol biopolymer transport system component